jgi:hypothetical protein
MKCESVLCFAVLALLLTGVAARGELIINEVIANEPGSETDLEWVELWNWADTSASLNDMSFVDGGLSTPLGDSIVLDPKEFMLLVRNIRAFEERWGDGSGAWGDAQIESFHILQTSMSLRNSGDTVCLLRNDDTVSFCPWTRTSSDGVSIERTDPRRTELDAVWGECIDSSGSSPARRNSLTPGDNSLSLHARFEVAGTAQDFAAIDATITNVGLSQSLPNRLRAGIDTDNDSLLSELESIVVRQIESLGEYESTSLQYQFEAPFGYQTVILTLDSDDNIADNDTLTTLFFGTTIGAIVINEVLPNPESPLECEWIELNNLSQHDLLCTGWSLCDAVGCAIMEQFVISAGEYLILCEDSLAFREFYDPINSEVLQVPGWQSLNNTGDTLRLLNGEGITVDSMHYMDVFTNSISIERIDPHASGFDLSNWYRSTADIGSTPGEVNSVIEGFGSDLTLELDSKIISPDGDGIDDFLTLHYSIPQGSALTLKVFDLDGITVRTIFNESYLSSGNFSFDGRDDSGCALDIGLYILYAKLSGGKEAEKKLVLAVVGR